jgi:ParB-like chromosome segregation protein Spo0J
MQHLLKITISIICCKQSFCQTRVAELERSAQHDAKLMSDSKAAWDKAQAKEQLVREIEKKKWAEAALRQVDEDFRSAQVGQNEGVYKPYDASVCNDCCQARQP